MEKMTAEERREFLSQGTRTAKLTTVRKDGSPHIAPVWFVLNGDEIIFTTGEDTVKGQNLAHDPRIALCVDDETPPFAFVIIEGTVKLQSNAPDLLYWATQIAQRYMGPALAEAYGLRNAVPGEYLVRVISEKIIARKGISD